MSALAFGYTSSAAPPPSTSDTRKLRDAVLTSDVDLVDGKAVAAQLRLVDDHALMLATVKLLPDLVRARIDVQAAETTKVVGLAVDPGDDRAGIRLTCSKWAAQREGRYCVQGRMLKGQKVIILFTE